MKLLTAKKRCLTVFWSNGLIVEHHYAVKQRPVKPLVLLMASYGKIHGFCPLCDASTSSFIQGNMIRSCSIEVNLPGITAKFVFFCKCCFHIFSHVSLKGVIEKKKKKGYVWHAKLLNLVSFVSSFVVIVILWWFLKIECSLDHLVV